MLNKVDQAHNNKSTSLEFYSISDVRLNSYVESKKVTIAHVKFNLLLMQV